MYIKIGDNQYPCTRRIVTGDTIKYLSATVYTPEEYAQAWEAV